MAMFKRDDAQLSYEVHGTGFPLADDGPLIEALVDARLTGAPPRLVELECDLEDALDVQVQVMRSLADMGHRFSGWKVGLTSGHAHDGMGVGFRPFGYILADHTWPSGATVTGGPKAGGHIEPELCLEMKAPLRGRDLPPETCRAAVGEVQAAFEINENRVKMPGPNRLFIADGLSNWGLVVGDGTLPRTGLETTAVDLFLGDELIQSSAPKLQMDDPFLSLSRLCSTLDRHGLGIEIGQHVITGAFFRYPITNPGVYRAVFHGLGEVAIEIGFQPD